MTLHIIFKAKKILICLLILSTLVYSLPSKIFEVNFALIPKANAAVTEILPNGAIGQSYSQFVQGSFYSYYGSLPSGLRLRGNWISGVPGQSGKFSITTVGGDVKTIIITILAPPPYFSPVPCCGAPNLISNQNGLAEFQFPWDATQNSFFDQSIYWVTGGNAPLKWSISAGALPAGVNLNSANGKFSGAPLQAGRYKFSVTVTDDANQSSTVNYRLNVVPLAPIINSGQTITLQPIHGENFTKNIPCNCSTGVNYNWYVAWGTLPSGLSLNPSTGEISGTPQSVSSTTAGLYLADNFGQKSSVLLNLNVNPRPLAITTPINLPNGKQGELYNFTLQANGGKEPYKWSIPGKILNINQIKWAYPVEISPELALTLSPSGVISGKIAGYGNFNFAVTVTDGNGANITKTLALKAIPAPPTIAIVGMDAPVKNLPGIWTNSYVDFSTTSTDNFNAGYFTGYGAGPLTWSVVKGALPPGINLDSTGRQTGLAKTAGTYYFTIKVTDAYGQSATKDVVQTAMNPSVVVQCAYESCNPDMSPNTSPAPEFSSASLAVATQGQNYSQTLSVSGGTAPYTFSIASGSLPPGLSLNSSTGVISGNPTTATSSSFGISFTVKVTDSKNKVAAKLLYIDVNQPSAQTPAPVSPAQPPLSLTTASLSPATQGQNYNAYLSANGGTTPYVFSIASGSLPAGLSLNSSTGIISGTPSASLTGNFAVKITDAKNQTVIGPTFNLTIHPAPASIPVAPVPAPTPPPISPQPRPTGFDAAVNVAETITSIMNQAVNTGVMVSTATLFGFLQGAMSIVESAFTLVFHPIQSANSLVNLDAEKIGRAALEGLKARYSAVIYINADDYVSVYNAGIAMGKTHFDACTVVCTLGSGVEIKGVQVGKVLVDTSSAANKAAEIAKVSEAISAAAKVPKGLYLGQDFGKLGVVIKTEPGSISMFTDYAKGRLLERNLSEASVREVIAKPLVRLIQSDGRILYLNEKAAAILDSSGRVITNYGSSDFQSDILAVLKLITK